MPAGSIRRLSPNAAVSNFRGKVLANRRALPLLGRKRAHQSVALLLLCGEDACTGVSAKARKHRLRAHEVGRQDELIAQHEAIDIEMMAVNLPAPGLVRGGHAKDADPIEPLAVFLGLPGDL